MEALGTAASVAGVLSLTGQIVDGIVKLRHFFKSIQGASKTVHRFLDDINLLIKTVEGIRDLLNNLSVSLSPAENDLKVAALEIQLQDCSKDIYRWLAIATDYHPDASTGTKASFKKFWVAANKAELSGISQGVINQLLPFFAFALIRCRALDVSSSCKLTSLGMMLTQTIEENEAFHEDSLSQLKKIDSIKKSSMVNLRHSRSSMSSLARIESSLQRIESVLKLEGVWKAQDSLSPSLIYNRRNSSSLIVRTPSMSKGHPAFKRSRSSSLVSKNLRETSLENISTASKKYQETPRVSFTLGGSSTSEGSLSSAKEQGFEYNEDESHNDSADGQSDDPHIEGRASLSSSKDLLVDRMFRGSYGIRYDYTRKYSLLPTPLNRTKILRYEPDLKTKAYDETTRQWNKPIPQDLLASSPPWSPLLSITPGETSDWRTNRENACGTTSQPEDEALSTSSMIHDAYKLFETGPAAFSKDLRSYIRNTRLSVTIKQEIALVSQFAPDNLWDAYTQQLNKFSAKVESRLSQLRKRCILSGDPLYAIDEIIECCNIHDPATGLRIPRENTAARHNDILTLRRKILRREARKSGSYQMWTSKRDRINHWLFNNLQNSSENAELHRSMLPEGDKLDTETWARSVIKYWPIDRAALGEEDTGLPSSSRGAIDSWGQDCQIRAQINQGPECIFRTPLGIQPPKPTIKAVYEYAERGNPAPRTTCCRQTLRQVVKKYNVSGTCP